MLVKDTDEGLDSLVAAADLDQGFHRTPMSWDFGSFPCVESKCRMMSKQTQASGRSALSGERARC
jgi:hypothetical protein